MFRHLLPLLLLSLLQPFCAAASRVALVIGVSDYQVFSRLDNPRQDHAEMVKALKELGYVVLDMHNPTRDQIAKLAQTFSSSHPDAKEVVIYYSGHGMQVQGKNYLTGIDSSLEVEKGLDELDRTSLSGEALVMAKEAHIRQTAEKGLLSLESVLGEIEKMGGAKSARVVILDCCRDNPLGTKTLASKSILQTKGGMAQESASGMLIAFAAKAGKTAEQTELGSTSLYTKALLLHIRTPGLEVEQVFKRARATVLELSNGGQEPDEYTNLTGNLVFNPSPSGNDQRDIEDELQKMKDELERLRRDKDKLTETSPTGIPGAAIPNTAPLPILPARGYFTQSELLSSSRYAGYNSYSKGQVLKAAQVNLKAQGHYTGGADGLAGPGTQKSILNFQQSRGLPVTGILDAPTLQALGIHDMSEVSPPTIILDPPVNPRDKVVRPRLNNTLIPVGGGSYRSPYMPNEKPFSRPGLESGWEIACPYTGKPCRVP